MRLGFNGSYNKTEYDTNSLINEQYKSFGLNLIFMYYLNPNSKFNIYGYLGGQYLYSGQSLDNEYESVFINNWSLGPILGVGAEYFVFNQLSLFAEYSYSFNFGEEESVSQRYEYPYEKYELKLNKVSLNPNPVKFGLSVYF